MYRDVMIKTLLSTAMLLLPIIAYGGNPSADLSVQVVPARSGGGALPGSILPPGNWVNDLDEHFSGTSINTSIWNVGASDYSVAGGVSNCQVPGTFIVNNGLNLFPLPPDSANNSNGCAVWSDYVWTTPGYFESYLQSDGGSGVWNGIFFEFGPNDSCGGNVGQNGTEIDLVEAFPSGVAQQSVWYNGYGSCFTGGVFRKDQSSADAYHVWGLDYGDNNSITWYRDGVQIASWSPPGGAEPGTCPTTRFCINGNWEGQFIFMDFGYHGTASNPTGLHVAWVRHYHH